MCYVARLMATALMLSVSGFAIAHPGGGYEDMTAGLLHPLSGLDHLLAMLAVGLWSGLRLRSRRWVAPLLFSVAMMVGGAMALRGIAAPFLEPALAASVVVFGLLIAAHRALPVSAGFVMIGFFAFFHGNAHGLETAVTTASFVVAFLASSLMLQFAGMWLVRRGRTNTERRAWRYAGAGIALTGALLGVV